MGQMLPKMAALYVKVCADQRVEHNSGNHSPVCSSKLRTFINYIVATHLQCRFSILYLFKLSIFAHFKVVYHR